MTLLLTGATGFIGSALCAGLSDAGLSFRRALRRTSPDPGLRDADDAVVGELGADTDWSGALSGVSAVIHLAARSHVTRETAAEPLALYRRVNVLGTVGLARAAAAAGVRHFIFLSSIKVNGERTERRPFQSVDPPHPEDAYGLSKWEAEQALAEIAATSGMRLTVLRPPLVYGPGVKGNFLTLMRAVDCGLPLPLASIDNRRSLIYVGNLVSAIIACLEHDAAGQNTFLLSDGEDLSTPDLARRIGDALGRPSRLCRMPPKWLRLAGKLSGRAAQIDRLCDSLQVDNAALAGVLGWTPPYTLAQGMAATAQWYRSAVSRH